MDDFPRFRYFQQSSYASCCGRPAATTAIPKKLLFQPFFSAPLQNSLISTADGGRRKKRLCNVKWSPSGEVPTNPKCVHSLASQSTGEIVVNRTYRVTRPPWIWFLSFLASVYQNTQKSIMRWVCMSQSRRQAVLIRFHTSFFLALLLRCSLWSLLPKRESFVFDFEMRKTIFVFRYQLWNLSLRFSISTALPSLGS